MKAIHLIPNNDVESKSNDSLITKTADDVVLNGKRNNKFLLAMKNKWFLSIAGFLTFSILLAIGYLLVQKSTADLSNEEINSLKYVQADPSLALTSLTALSPTVCGMKLALAVVNFEDSLTGDCSTPSSSSLCNLRACISYLQGKTGACVLATGVHKVTFGELGLTNIGLEPNTDIMVTSISGPETTIIDGSSRNSNTRLMTLDENTASIHFVGVQVKNFVMDTVGYFKNCQARSMAGVLQLQSGNAYIKNSIFKKNTAGSCSVFQVNADKSSILIENSEFVDNLSINMDMCNNYCNTNGAICILWDTNSNNAKPYSINNVTFTNNALSADDMNSLQTWCPNLPGAAIVTSYKWGFGNCYFNFNQNTPQQMCYGNGYYREIECVTPNCLQGHTNVTYTGCLNELFISAPTSSGPSAYPTIVPTAGVVVDSKYLTVKEAEHFKEELIKSVTNEAKKIIKKLVKEFESFKDKQEKIIKKLKEELKNLKEN